MVSVKQYGSLAALFFCLNAIVGAGFLGMPYVLYNGGVLYGLFLIVFISILAIAAAEWTIEAMARAESFKAGLESDSKQWPIALVSDERRFEVGDLCRLFIHPWLGHCYDAAVIFNTVMCLWIYGTLAASSWSSEIPFSGSTFHQCDSSNFLHHLHPDGACWNAYALCVLFFGAIVVPISCLELHSQVIFQTVMGIFRIVVIASMSTYSLVGAVGRNDTNSTLDSQQHVWLHFDFRQWSGVIPVVSFALVVHFMIPTFCQSVKNKKHLRPIFTVALSLALFLYVIVGASVAMFFSHQVNETCTLTWIQKTKPGHNIFLRIYSYLLVVFPSIDLCSGYPLIVNVGINILSSLLKDVGGIILSGSNVIIGRFCLATIPLIGSLFVSNLVAVSDYAGLFYTIALFIIPALLHFFSKWKSTKVFNAGLIQSDSDDTDAETDCEPGNIQVSLLKLTSRGSKAGEVANCYKPVIGNNFLAAGSAGFGLVAIAASVLSWFTKH